MKKKHETEATQQCNAVTPERTTELPYLCNGVMENSPLPMVAVEGMAHIVCYVNLAFCRLAGKTKAELFGKAFVDAVPEGERNGCSASLERVYHIGTSESIEDQEHTQTPSHPAYWSYTLWAVLGPDGHPIGVLIHVTDTTTTVLARRQSEKMNEDAREMNEALLLSGVRQHELTEIAELLNARLHRAMQESHHRIKNNLQVVAALVEMQMDEGGASAGDEHLKRIKQHIRALANIHTLLTQQAKNKAPADTLGTEEILEQLIPLLEETSGGRRITAQIANFLLPMQKAASLSLLVSECVSNAIKHSKGDIDITLRVEGDNARLEVCDDGTGFPPDFDWRKAAHTGLALIDGTARHDLRGEVRYEKSSHGGGRVAISFPIPTLTKSNRDAK